MQEIKNPPAKSQVDLKSIEIEFILLPACQF